MPGRRRTGCTEFPLILAESDDFSNAGKTVALINPTDTLARKCVELSRQETC